MMSGTLERISRRIATDIDEKLQAVGILFRIFSRVKDTASAEEKISTKEYASTGKKLQDLVGVRIAAYFHDDIDLIYKIVADHFDILDETIDSPKDDHFSPERHNIVLKIPVQHIEEFQQVNKNPLIDSTFELQIRTVLSEGWHEVEHDMRYKCKEEWANHSDLSRVLNGIWATLSNCDWSTISLFEEMAYRNYKNYEWQSMLRNKFRIRLAKSKLDSELANYYSKNSEFTKRIYRIERNNFLNELYKSKAKLPLTYDNISFMMNFFFIKDSHITSITPKFILNELR